MTDMLELEPDDCVLEIGAGAGYQGSGSRAARARGRHDRHHRRARYGCGAALKRLGYDNVRVHVGNGLLRRARAPRRTTDHRDAACELIPPAAPAAVETGRAHGHPDRHSEKQALTLVQKSASGHSPRAIRCRVRFSSWKTGRACRRRLIPLGATQAFACGARAPSAEPAGCAAQREAGRFGG